MLKTVGNPSTRYGDQTIIGGNLVIGTGGKGIDFSATSQAAGMASELLDDYEEGTWTPIIEGTGTAGLGTYTTQSGKYTKIGDTVYFWVDLTWTAFTGTSGLRIKGFPFVPNNAGSFFPIQIQLNNYTLTANNIPYGLMHPTLAIGYVFQQPVGGGAAAEVPTDTAATLNAFGAYKV